MNVHQKEVFLSPGSLQSVWKSKAVLSFLLVSDDWGRMEYSRGPEASHIQYRSVVSYALLPTEYTPKAD